MKLEINIRYCGNYINMWKLSNLLLNNKWVKKEIKKETRHL